MDFGPKYYKILFGLDDLFDMEEKRRVLCDYDLDENYYSKSLVNNKLKLAQEQLQFIGNAFISPHFSTKNKLQLLKFLLTNIKSCQNAKDAFIRVQKLFNLLMICLSIVSKMYHECDDKSSIADLETLKIFREICEYSIPYTNNHVRVTCALIYSMLFKLSKNSEFQEELVQ